MPSERPLPKLLKQRENWETWAPVRQLPSEFRTRKVYEAARVRDSTGAIFESKLNRDASSMELVQRGSSSFNRDGT